MQEISKTLFEANKMLKTADHLAYITYPLVRDNKIMITITNNLTGAMTKAIEALLDYDRYYKRIMYIPNDFQSKLEVFRKSCAPRYNISTSYLALLKELKDIEEARKSAAMEFIRKDQYVITQNNFKLRTLTYPKIKEYVNQSKQFFNKINAILENVETR